MRANAKVTALMNLRLEILMLGVFSVLFIPVIWIHDYSIFSLVYIQTNSYQEDEIKKKKKKKKIVNFWDMQN
jgi:hypothetical protein